MVLIAELLALSLAVSEPIATGALPLGVSWHAPVERPGEGAGSFAAVLVREHVGPGRSDFVASAWDVRLTPDASIVPRIRFERSGWSPDLLDRRSRRGRNDLLRLQVPTGDRYRVNVYSIDYGEWSVSTVLHGRQAHALFSHGERVYIDVAGLDPTEEGLRIIGEDNTMRVPAEPFRYVRGVPGHPDLHLVVRDGEHALFDAEAESFLELPSMPDWIDEGATSDFCLSADRGWYVVHSKFDGAEQLTSFSPLDSQLVTTRVTLVDRTTGEATEIPTAMTLGYGSGVLFVGGNPLLGFDDAGRLILTEAQRAPSVDGVARYRWRVHAITPGDGARETLEEAPVLPADDPGRGWAVGPLPDDVVEILGEGRHQNADVAVAFLRTKGIELDFERRFVFCECGFSADGSRFLLKTTEPGFDEWFFAGDLGTGRVKKIPSPDALVRANDLNIVVLE